MMEEYCQQIDSFVQSKNSITEIKEELEQYIYI